MSGEQAEAGWWKPFQDMLNSRDFFSCRQWGKYIPNFCFGYFTAGSPQTHCFPHLKHIFGITRGQTCTVVQFGLFWFTTECIMNDNCLLCGLKVPAVTVYVSVHTEPGLPWSQEPPSSGLASWCVRMCGFFYFAKSTVLGRGTEALPQIHFPRKSFISFNPSTLPKSSFFGSSTLGEPSGIPSRYQGEHSTPPHLQVLSHFKPES